MNDDAGTSITIPQTDALLARGEADQAPIITAAAVAADTVAAHHVFSDALQRLAPASRLRYEGDLALFGHYLVHVQSVRAASTGTIGADLLYKPSAWRNVSWGLVSGFVKWMLDEGYAIGSVNSRLSTVKRFAGLALEAGAISDETCLRIRNIRGYGGKAARNVDEQREIARVGSKKAESLVLSPEQLAHLKQQPDTPVGRRDLLLICLLFDQGLRIGEAAALLIGALELGTAFQSSFLTFYRQKVGITQKHELSADTFEAARRHLRTDLIGASSSERLFRGSRKDGSLVGSFGVRSMQDRVKILGERIGVAHLSPHDGRHTWASDMAEAGTPANVIRDAGGWANFQTPSRYIARSKVANAGQLRRRGGKDLRTSDQEAEDAHS